MGARDNDGPVHIKHDRTETVDNNETITVHGKRAGTVDKDETLKVGQQIQIDAGTQITIQTGASKIVMKADGTIEIKGVLITSEASGIHTIKGSLVKIN